MSLLGKNYRQRYFFVWLVFLFLALLIYGAILNDFFLSDDWHWFYLAQQRSVDWQILLTNYAGQKAGGSYNPFLFLFYKFAFSILGLKYFWYHVVSIVLHSFNALLVFILAKKIFNLGKIGKSHNWGVVAGILFLIWPVSVETITWIAAWAHVLPVSFYLLTLVSYFSYRLENRKSYIYYSLLFFILALLTKEISITLPIIILLWEIYFYSINKKNKQAIFYLPVYFVLLVAFFILRYISTAIVFGYYGQQELQFTFAKWVATLVPFISELFTFSFLRIPAFKAVYYLTNPLAIFVLVILASYFYYLFLKKKWLTFTLILTFLISLVPAILVGLHHTTFAGERYLYLPLSFFIVWILYIFIKLKWNFKTKASLLLIFAFISLLVIEYKKYLWQEASDLSRQIITSYQDLNLAPGQKLATVALPDNISGAEVYRNNLNQGLYFMYPETHPEIVAHLPVYVFVNPENKNDKLLNWRRHNIGWLAESVDGGQIVTGFTSIEYQGFYFELWNYNYQNYKANVIRLIPTAETLETLDTGELKLMYFDQGKLNILE
ncbi:hypothetical protein C4566_02385 [Candidatus Parcubacteria bacterium]|nr:MAG: hypothetical protein C4566_02385 [Candidatus Parcubacteria bacterium]